MVCLLAILLLFMVELLTIIIYYGTLSHVRIGQFSNTVGLEGGALFAFIFTFLNNISHYAGAMNMSKGQVIVKSAHINFLGNSARIGDRKWCN